MRHNPDLDHAFEGPTENVNSTRLPKQKRRRRKTGLPKDHVRRYAFRVLAILAGLPENERRRVLAVAAKLNTVG
jgi:hypothetical protein